MALLPRLLVTCLSLACCLLQTGCLVLPEQIATEMSPARPGEANPFARSAVPAAATAFNAAISEARASAVPLRHAPLLTDLPLASGQLVLSNQTGPNGYFVSLFASEYQPWTHVGILSLEADGPVVYDSDGDLQPIPGFPPSMFGDGRVRRLPFQEFLDTKHMVGIYALPPGVDATKVVSYARRHYELGTPFDHYFNAEDSSALYCAELVARALEAGGAPLVVPAPMRDNRSVVQLRQWMRIPKHRMIFPGQLISPERLVARWGGGFSPAQIDADFEVRRELSRRFDPEVRLGFLFEMRPRELLIRDEVRTFLVDVIARFATFEGDVESIRREVRRLADLYFVNLPAGPVAAANPSQLPR